MRFKLNYRGGGLVIATTDSAGRLNILLGKRLKAPGAGTWSFPGGESLRYRGMRRKLGLAVYVESCGNAALRETDEEIKLWPGAPELPRVDEIVHLWGFRTCFYDWSTWGWKVDNQGLKPATVRNPPEFSELGWFSVDALPTPLHVGVKAAVRSARRRWKAGSPGGKTL